MQLRTHLCFYLAWLPRGACDQWGRREKSRKAHQLRRATLRQVLQLPDTFAQEVPGGELGLDLLDAHWLPGFGKAAEAPASFLEG